MEVERFKRRYQVSNPNPSQNLSSYSFIVTIVGEMVTRVSFASRESVMREWLRSGLTRTGTTLLMVYLSLVCHYSVVRRWREVFRHGEKRVPATEEVFWRGRSDQRTEKGAVRLAWLGGHIAPPPEFWAVSFSRCRFEWFQFWWS
jgi:hypothetical protein